MKCNAQRNQNIGQPQSNKSTQLLTPPSHLDCPPPQTRNPGMFQSNNTNMAGGISVDNSYPHCPPPQTRNPGLLQSNNTNMAGGISIDNSYPDYPPQTRNPGLFQSDNTNMAGGISMDNSYCQPSPTMMYQPTAQSFAPPPMFPENGAPYHQPLSFQPPIVPPDTVSFLTHFVKELINKESMMSHTNHFVQC